MNDNYLLVAAQLLKTPLPRNLKRLFDNRFNPCKDQMSYKTFYRVILFLDKNGYIIAKKVGNGKNMGVSTLITKVNKNTLSCWMTEVRIKLEKEQEQAKNKKQA